MKKRNVLKNNYDFNRIIDENHFLKNNNFIVYYSKNDIDDYRIGISVGKKIGKAVIRNKYKRKIRSICDLCSDKFLDNYDYIIIVRKSCLTTDFKTLINNLEILINKVNKKQGENNEKKQ